MVSVARQRLSLVANRRRHHHRPRRRGHRRPARQGPARQTRQGGTRVRRVPRRERPGHTQLRGALPRRRDHLHLVRGIRRQPGHQQTHGQKTADALEPPGAHLLLQIRTRVLNDTLNDTLTDDYRRWYPDFNHTSPGRTKPRSLPRFVPLSNTSPRTAASPETPAHSPLRSRHWHVEQLPATSTTHPEIRCKTRTCRGLRHVTQQPTKPLRTVNNHPRRSAPRVGAANSAGPDPAPARWRPRSARTAGPPTPARNAGTSRCDARYARRCTRTVPSPRLRVSRHTRDHLDMRRVVARTQSDPA